MDDDQLRKGQERERRDLGLEGADGKPPAVAPKPVTVPCRFCGEPITVTPLPGPFGLTPFSNIAHAACIIAEEQRAAEEEREARSRARQAALVALRADLPGALERCGVPRHWLDASFDLCPDLPAKLSETARRWAEKPAGILYLYGVPGSGKTYLGVSVLRAVLEAGTLPRSACQFIRERCFLDGLKASFTPDAAPVNPRLLPMHHPRRVELLLLDDLASSRLTDWAKGELAGLLEARHAADLPTILTSNIAPGALAEVIDGRVASRVAESHMMLQFPPRDLRVAGTLKRRAEAPPVTAKAADPPRRADP